MHILYVESCMLYQMLPIIGQFLLVHMMSLLSGDDLIDAHLTARNFLQFSSLCTRIVSFTCHRSREYEQDVAY